MNEIKLSNFSPARETTVKDTKLHAVATYQSRDKATGLLIPIIKGQEQSLLTIEDEEGNKVKVRVFDNVFPFGKPIKVGFNPIPIRVELVENTDTAGVVWTNIVSLTYETGDLHEKDILLMSRVGFSLS
jgi:hypothetical protein